MNGYIKTVPAAWLKMFSMNFKVSLLLYVNIDKVDKSFVHEKIYISDPVSFSG